MKSSRPLGRTGMNIAPVVFGGNVFGWSMDEAQSFRVLDAFIDHGFDAIDTADVYSRFADGLAGGESETILGRWFAARPGMRDKVKLFTKVGLDMGGPGEKGLSERWITEGIERSLTRLNTDYVDLYFAHIPDPDTDHAETLGAFEKLLTAGKIRAIGASNFGADLLQQALAASAATGLPEYQVVQPRYNLCDRDDFEGPLRDLCIERGIGVITYFSLASGFLSGKYRTMADIEQSQRAPWLRGYMTEGGTRLIEVLNDVSANLGAKPAEVALAWLIAQPGVTAPIASATSVSQVESFGRAAELELSAEDLARLSDPIARSVG
ncbi:aldo/keto reductase [Croceicoccus ponticola]|uniref:Aldo/keto reductase n=1 Tax=Croceicoccus ponticola TaxID=2217664 RepID=A0A437H128_9SPHN|nr:aldo/keto reductase [Croceicoccus ponticola]RVQ69354.1 aldo/keto reductase [Croceicoccus ponticola]